MTLKTAQAKANREKPAAGIHRFTWGQPYGIPGTLSQIGRCTCGAEVILTSVTGEYHVLKQHRTPEQQPPKTTDNERPAAKNNAQNPHTFQRNSHYRSGPGHRRGAA